jgi:hypothetical protein
MEGDGPSTPSKNNQSRRSKIWQANPASASPLPAPGSPFARNPVSISPRAKDAKKREGFGRQKDGFQGTRALRRNLESGKVRCLIFFAFCFLPSQFPRAPPPNSVFRIPLFLRCTLLLRPIPPLLIVWSLRPAKPRSTTGKTCGGTANCFRCLLGAMCRSGTNRRPSVSPGR